jgi:hypothetical protein
MGFIAITMLVKQWFFAISVSLRHCGSQEMLTRINPLPQDLTTEEQRNEEIRWNHRSSIFLCASLNPWSRI